MKHCITIVLTALAAYLLLSSFYSGGNAPKLLLPTKVEVNTHGKDVDAMAYLSNMGIAVTVDEAALTERYGNVELTQVPGDKLTWSFPNGAGKGFTLEVYNNFGDRVVTLMDIYNNEVSLDAGFFGSDTYIYKLSGNGNTYAGKFSVK